MWTLLRLSHSLLLALYHLTLRVILPLILFIQFFIIILNLLILIIQIQNGVFINDVSLLTTSIATLVLELFLIFMLYLVTLFLIFFQVFLWFHPPICFCLVFFCFGALFEIQETEAHFYLAALGREWRCHDIVAGFFNRISAVQTLI